MVKTTPMPNMIVILNYRMEWLSYGTYLGIFEDYKMAGNNIYITWDTPFGSVPTAKRVHWACEKAHGSETIEQAADGIWHAIGEPVDPPYEPGERPLKEGADWELLDGLVSGECDEQANLMKKALNIIGVPAETWLVYDSRHNDPDVLSLDSRPSGVPGYMEYLILMMPGPNAFEGCVVK